MSTPYLDSCEIQEEWGLEASKRILEILQVVDPLARLAGGAPRNWYFGKPARDLDFYVRTALDYESFKEVMNIILVKSQGLYFKNIISSSIKFDRFYHDENTNIIGVIDLDLKFKFLGPTKDRTANIDCQIIACRDWPKFDITLCNIFYNLESLRINPETQGITPIVDSLFRKSILDKTIYIDNEDLTEGQKSRTNNKIKKVQELVPDWPVEYLRKKKTNKRLKNIMENL